MTEVDRDFPALACGIDRDEGVVIAYIPTGDAIMDEHEYRDGDRTFTLFSMDGVALDMLPQDRKTVKWWMVREAAREHRLQFIEPIKACAAEDFRVSCLPQVPQPEGTVLAFRQYSRGPWITMTKDQDGNYTTAPA